MTQFVVCAWIQTNINKQITACWSNNFFWFFEYFLENCLFGIFSHIWCPKQCVIVSTCLYTYHFFQKFLLFHHLYVNERQNNVLEDHQPLFVHVYWYLLIFDISVNFIHPPAVHSPEWYHQKKNIFRIFLCLWANSGKQWQTNDDIWSHDIQGRFMNFSRILQICLSFFSERKSIPAVKSMNEWINENGPANWDWKNESLIN